MFLNSWFQWVSWPSKQGCVHFASPSLQLLCFLRLTANALKIGGAPKGNDRLPIIRFQVLQLMEEILHQLMGSASHYSQGLYILGGDRQISESSTVSYYILVSGRVNFSKIW